MVRTHLIGIGRVVVECGKWQQAAENVIRISHSSVSGVFGTSPPNASVSHISFSCRTGATTGTVSRLLREV